MKKVAFVTYNTLGNLVSGWHTQDDRSALVLQNTKGEGSLIEGPIGRDNRMNQIGVLWSELQRSIPTLDHVVVYVGADGSQRAIAMAAQLPPSKVTFVACDCGLSIKEALIQASGMSEAGRILCACGGHYAMRGLFDHFMATGTLLPDSA